MSQAPLPTARKERFSRRSCSLALAAVMLGFGLCAGTPARAQEQTLDDCFAVSVLDRTMPVEATGNPQLVATTGRMSSSLPGPMVQAPEVVAFEDLVVDAEAVCEVWVAGVEEAEATLGSNRFSWAWPMRATFVSKWPLKGSCPERFEITWSFLKMRFLGEYGKEAILFMRRRDSETGAAWELVTEPQGAWEIERRRTHSLSDETLAFIAPESLTLVEGVPEGLLSELELEFQASFEDRVYSRSRVVLSNSLGRWFEAKKELTKVGADGRP